MPEAEQVIDHEFMPRHELERFASQRCAVLFLAFHVAYAFLDQPDHEVGVMCPEFVIGIIEVFQKPFACEHTVVIGFDLAGNAAVRISEHFLAEFSF